MTVRASWPLLGLLVVLTTPQPGHAQEIGRVWLDACLKTAWEAGDTGTRCIGRGARHCQERPESDSTHGEIACYRKEAAIWDDMLNAEYAALLRAAGKAQAEKVREAQRLWLRGQAADCEMPMVLLEGTMAQPMIAACQMSTTAERALTLRGWRLLISPR